MKIYIHNIYITYKIVYKSGVEKQVKKILTSNISEIYGPIIFPKNSAKNYPKSTSTRNFEEIKTIIL